MSQLQARRADFRAWCAARDIADEAEKTRYWVAYSAGWEECADRVWGTIEKALSGERIETEEPALGDPRR